MARVTFTTAAEYLAEQLQAGSVRRVGIVARVALGNVVDVTQRLDDMFQGAWDRLDAAMERMLADFSDENQRSTVEFSYVGSRRIPVERQLDMLEVGRNSTAVTAAAASQSDVPAEVQRYLVRECYDHKMAMAALARNRNADFAAIEPLAAHPDQDIRLALASNIGPQMRLSAENGYTAKQAVYNSLLNHYVGDFAPYLVPVCKDGEQLERMYTQTMRTPGNARLFVDNPFSPDHVLLDISTLGSLRMIPGGSAVAQDAKQQLEKRLLVESDAGPRPY